MKWYFTFRKSYGCGFGFDFIYFPPYKTRCYKAGNEFYCSLTLLRWGFEFGFDNDTVDILEEGKKDGK